MGVSDVVAQEDITRACTDSPSKQFKHTLAASLDYTSALKLSRKSGVTGLVQKGHLGGAVFVVSLLHM